MILIPLLVFLVGLLLTSLWAERHTKTTSFTLQYFVGERTLNGFVLAMTLVATYGSVSSFVSGPGIAWNLGLGWVVFAAPQVIAGFLLLGVAGKKLALVGRVTGAVTVIDIIRARYGNHRVGRCLAVLLALLMLLFFTTMMVGQFIGGAQIFAKAAHIDYPRALLLFGVLTVAYTGLGGFRVVAFTDMICALFMMVGMVLLGGYVLDMGGGLTAIMTKLATMAPRPGTEPGVLLDPFAGGTLSFPLLLSAWVLVGFGTLGLPQSAVRALSYRTSADLHQAMWISTVVCGALMIGMTLLGVLIRGVMDVPVAQLGSTDAMMPTFIAQHMPPWIAGVMLIGPLAATMSTVSSLLLAASSAIIKDLLLVWRPEWETQSARGLTYFTKGFTTLLGVVALLLALFPLDVIAWINLFAFGGLELAFLLPLIGGLFWSRATAWGALTSVLGSLVVYLSISVFKIPVGGFHAIVPAMLVAFALYVGVSLLGRPEAAPAFFARTKRD